MLTQICFDEIDQTIAAATAGCSEVEAVAELCCYFACLPVDLEYGVPRRNAADFSLITLPRLQPRTRRSPQTTCQLRPTATYRRFTNRATVVRSENSCKLTVARSKRSICGVVRMYWNTVPTRGQIALQLGRMGCNVTVVDIERRYLYIIASEASLADLGHDGPRPVRQPADQRSFGIAVQRVTYR